MFVGPLISQSAPSIDPGPVLLSSTVLPMEGTVADVPAATPWLTTDMPDRDRVREGAIQIAGGDMDLEPWANFATLFEPAWRDPASAYACFMGMLAECCRANKVTGVYLAWSGAVECLIYEGRDYRELDCWIRAFDDLPAAFGGSTFEAMLQAKVSLLMALLLRHPSDRRLPGLARELAAVVQIWREWPQIPVLVNRLMQYYVWSGRAAEAAALRAFVRDQLPAPDGDLASEPCLQAAMAAYQCLHSGAMIDVEHDGGSPGVSEGNRGPWSYQLSAYAAYMALQRRDSDRFEIHLRGMQHAAREHGRHDIAHCQLLKAWACIHAEDLGRAFEHACCALTLARELGAPMLEGFCHLAVRQILLEQEQDMSRRQIEHFHNQVQASGSRLLQCLASLMDVQKGLCQAEDASTRKLGETLRMIEGHGYANLPWCTERSLRRLCETAIREDVAREHACKLVRRNHLTGNPVELEAWPHYLKIYTLGRFSILLNDEPVRFVGKPQRRPIDLLKALVALGGRDVGVERLCEALWPDADGDAAHHAFETALYRLRKLLGRNHLICVQGGNVTLDNRDCWIDTWAFERLSGRIDRLLKREDAHEQDMQLKRLAGQALSLYKGHFLGDCDTEAWSVVLREKLRGKFVRLLLSLGRFWEERRRFDEAILYYERGLETDHLIEVFYERLIICYGKTGRIAEAMNVYRRCQRVLSVVFGIQPSEQTVAAIRRFMRHQ